MALSAGESFSGGQVRDTQSRSVVISETTDAAVTAGDFYSGGFLCDPDSRTVICQDAAHSALTANEQYTAGDVRDKAGRLVCAAETVNSAISAGSQFSGGWLRDSRGRRIIALDTLGSALSAGEQFTAGQIRDSVGRLVLATETAAPVVVAHTAIGSSGTSVTTAPINTSGAKLLVVAVSSDVAGSSVTDSKSNTWAQLSFHINGGGIRLYYCSSPTVGTGHTFTETAGAFSSLAVAAFSVGLASTVADIDIGAAALNPGSATPANNNEILVTALGEGGVGAAATVSGGFTITDDLTFLPATYFGVAMAYLVQGTATLASPTWTGGSSQATAMASWRTV